MIRHFHSPPPGPTKEKIKSKMKNIPFHPPTNTHSIDHTHKQADTHERDVRVDKIV